MEISQRMIYEYVMTVEPGIRGTLRNVRGASAGGE